MNNHDATVDGKGATNMERVTETWRWQRILGRLEQIRQGTDGLLKESALLTPEWPIDKARVVKAALFEASRAIKRAELAAEEAGMLAQHSERITLTE